MESPSGLEPQFQWRRIPESQFHHLSVIGTLSFKLSGSRMASMRSSGTGGAATRVVRAWVKEA